MKNGRFLENIRNELRKTFGVENWWAQTTLIKIMIKFRTRIIFFRGLLIYMLIGFLLSLSQNINGYYSDKLTVFAWTGSVYGNMIILFWWLIVPTIFWPVDIFWLIYHKAI